MESRGSFGQDVIFLKCEDTLQAKTEASGKRQQQTENSDFPSDECKEDDYVVPCSADIKDSLEFQPLQD